MLSSPDFYMRSQDEMKALFEHIPEAIENTVKIANMCDIELSVGKWILPKFPLPENETAESFLEKLIWERVAHRYPTMTDEIDKRIRYELDIITKKDILRIFLSSLTLSIGQRIRELAWDLGADQPQDPSFHIF